MPDSKTNGLLLTGLLAILGTVVGGVVQGYWDNNLAKSEAQSKLIMKALEPDNTKQRIASLEFLVKVNLISDPEVRKGLQTVLNEGESAIPQFLPINTIANIGSIGSDRVDDSKKKILEKFPQLKGKNVALVGFKISSGQVIDSITPIYSKITRRLELTGEFEGDRIGGTGGDETVLKYSGYVVTGFEIQRASYFGRSEVIHIRITWNKLTSKGVNMNSPIVSRRFGSGEYSKNPKPIQKYYASSGAFISNISATVSKHTDGKTYLNDVAIKETMVANP